MPTKTYHIGVEATMEIIGGKWKSIILCHLRHHTMRTGELARAIPQISQKMLTSNYVNSKPPTSFPAMSTSRYRPGSTTR